MKRQLNRLAGMAMACGVALASAAWAEEHDDSVTARDVLTELSETFDTLGQYAAAERDEAVATIRRSLDRVDRQIARLESRARENWSGMSEAAQERTTQALADLRERRNDLSEMLGALGRGADDAWEDMVGGMKAGWQDLTGAWATATEAVDGDDSDDSDDGKDATATEGDGQDDQ